MIDRSLKTFLEDLAVYDWNVLKTYSLADFQEGLEKNAEYAKFAIENGIGDNFILKGEAPIDSLILDMFVANGVTTFRTYSSERGGMLSLREFKDFEEALAYSIYWKCNDCAAGKLPSTPL